jgi:hypothetical protein
MKKKVSSKEMADGLWMFCKKFTEGFYVELIPKIEKVGIKLDKVQKERLSIEIFQLNLWIISKALADDKSTLNELHKIYISGLADLAGTEEEKNAFMKRAEKELTEVYKKYYDAWDDESGGNQTVLSGVMLEQLLNEGILDMRLTFIVNLHVLGTMKEVLEFRNGFEIK